MGKHNSKLKNDTLDRLTAETYCKCSQETFRLLLKFRIHLVELSLFQSRKKKSSSGTRAS